MGNQDYRLNRISNVINIAMGQVILQVKHLKFMELINGRNN